MPTHANACCLGDQQHVWVRVKLPNWSKLPCRGSPTVADLPLKQILWTDCILRAAWGVTWTLTPALLSLGPWNLDPTGFRLYLSLYKYTTKRVYEYITTVSLLVVSGDFLPRVCKWSGPVGATRCRQERCSFWHGYCGMDYGTCDEQGFFT